MELGVQRRSEIPKAGDIAKEMNLNIKTVQSYLPRIRPVYGENISENALRIKRSREKRKSHNI